MLKVVLEYTLGLGIVSKLVGARVWLGVGHKVHFHCRSSWWAGTFQEPFLSLGLVSPHDKF